MGKTLIHWHLPLLCVHPIQSSECSWSNDNYNVVANQVMFGGVKPPSQAVASANAATGTDRLTATDLRSVLSRSIKYCQLVSPGARLSYAK